MKKKKNNKGFSLVELIVVIAIMAVLVGVLAPQFIGYVAKSKVSTDLQNADSLKSAVEIAIAEADSASTATVTVSGSGKTITVAGTGLTFAVSSVSLKATWTDGEYTYSASTGWGTTTDSTTTDVTPNHALSEVFTN